MEFYILTRQGKTASFFLSASLASLVIFLCLVEIRLGKGGEGKNWEEYIHAPRGTKEGKWKGELL